MSKYHPCFLFIYYWKKVDLTVWHLLVVQWIKSPEFLCREVDDLIFCNVLTV